MDRLTTDNPQYNFETLMNLAYAKDGDVFIRGEDPIGLNDYVRGICKCKCGIEDGIESDEDLTEMVMDCVSEEPGCSVAMLFAIATQAAELRGRLKEYEDAEEQGRIVVLPCKVGDMVWLNDMDGKPREMVLDSPDIRCHCKRDDEFSCCMPVCDNPKNGICAHRLKNDGSEIGKTVFLAREEAEAALRKKREK